MQSRNKKAGIVAVAVAAIVLLTAASCDAENSAAKSNEEQTNRQLAQYNTVQPVPFHDWSQYRQTALDIDAAKVNGVATTSFFFNNGVVDPIDSCPSIGFPLPSTIQITSPDQVEWWNGGSAVSEQMEPNGTYTGESSATYVICVAPNGDLYPSYWEGNVKAEGGAAQWNYDLKRIELVGDPTVEMTRGRG